MRYRTPAARLHLWQRKWRRCSACAVVIDNRLRKVRIIYANFREVVHAAIQWRIVLNDTCTISPKAATLTAEGASGAATLPIGETAAFLAVVVMAGTRYWRRYWPSFGFSFSICAEEIVAGKLAHAPVLPRN